MRFFCLITLALATNISMAQSVALFDAKSAESFFASTADLSAASKEYDKKAMLSYEAIKLKNAQAELFISKYLHLLSESGEALPNDARAFLLSQTTLLEDFISILSPKDNITEVFKILADIWKMSPEKFKKYPRLAIAIAIVFDTPVPKNWPHHQVAEKLLPRQLPSPTETFSKIVDMREKGKFLMQTERMSIEELKYLVPSLATNDDKEWAQKSVSTNISNLEKLYSSIEYDFPRYNRKAFDWEGSDYRLKTIKSKGGICTDQAYYTTEVSKARGVPAFIFTGAGSDGFHAWVAIMQKSGSWNFDVGRYEGARFVTGTTIDPQTWDTASDHSLESMREGFRNGAKYQLSQLHTLFAKKFLQSAEYDKAIAATQVATTSDNRNMEAWETMVLAMEKSGKSESDICATYEQAIKSFFKYPDIDADFRIRLMDRYIKNNNPEAARKLSTSIIIKTKQNRPDITMSFARRELEQDIASGDTEKLFSSYKRLLTLFKNDSAIAVKGITIPILNSLLHANKINDTSEIMKITKAVLKPKKDSTVTSTFSNIEAQLEKIIEKAKTK